MSFNRAKSQSLFGAIREESKEMGAVNLENIDRVIVAFENLSNSIKELAVATATQKPPVVINLIGNNDEDIKRFATIFKEGLK